MRIGRDPPTCRYTLTDPSGGQVELRNTTSIRDLGVVVDSNLLFTNHINTQICKANRVLATIRRTITSLDTRTLPMLYKTLVRPLLEYGQEVWSPLLKKDVDAIERVQRRATKLIFGLRNLTYKERLRALDLPSLVHRRFRGDLITMFKLSTGRLQADLGLSFDNNLITRGHSKRIIRRGCKTNIRKHFFVNRITNAWNKLPEHVVKAKSVNIFKNEIDRLFKLDMYSCAWRY